MIYSVVWSQDFGFCALILLILEVVTSPLDLISWFYAALLREAIFQLLR